MRSGNSHVTSQPGVFPRHPPFQGLLRPSFISPRHTDGPPNIRDTSGTSGNVFAHPQASSSAPCPQGLNSIWKKTIEEPIHMSTAEKSGRPERDQDLRCQSGPSAKDSVIFSGGDYSQVQSSFLLDVVVRLCPVIVHSICIPNSCIFLIAKTGLFRQRVGNEKQNLPRTSRKKLPRHSGITKNLLRRHQ